jgi:CheY-like chemotaxis protein
VTTRILLVDDSEQWRLLVRSILERTEWFLVVGEARDGVEAIAKATATLCQLCRHS